MKIQFPAKVAKVLFEPHRYLVIYGGRGSSKSWCVARALLIKGLQKTTRILCCREFQGSIAESVHALLSQQIELMGLQSFYVIQNASIVGANGTEFIFAGLKHNIHKIKSTEGVDVCWVEEAQTVSKASWDTLVPTIRKEVKDENGKVISEAEIWATFNPELDTDETYKRFVLSPPSSACVISMNWEDNPFFPEVLRKEKDELKEKDYDSYLNVWEGKCRQTIDGAIFAKELRNTIKEGRICRVPAIPGKPIDTFWDLGKRDHTSVWFVQFEMGQYRIIDFYQNRGEDLGHYLKILQERSYLYGMHFLPHDAAHNRLGALSIEKQFKAIYPQKVKVLERIPKKHMGIDAARAIFPLCYFDEAKCADGLQALRRYKYDVNKDTGQYSKDPLHDENSDAADAFLQIAMGVNAHKPKTQSKTISISKHGNSTVGTGWMGM